MQQPQMDVPLKQLLPLRTSVRTRQSLSQVKAFWGRDAPGSYALVLFMKSPLGTTWERPKRQLVQGL